MTGYPSTLKEVIVNGMTSSFDVEKLIRELERQADNAWQASRFFNGPESVILQVKQQTLLGIVSAIRKAQNE